jgi:hypothetical protein
MKSGRNGLYVLYLSHNRINIIYNESVCMFCILSHNRINIMKSERNGMLLHFSHNMWEKRPPNLPRIVIHWK